MNKHPVFRNNQDYSLWKKLEGRVSNRNLKAIVQEITSSNSPIHPVILITLMEVLENANSIDVDTFVRIVSKSRPYDATPAVKAAEILSKNGNLPAARSILTECKSKDVFTLKLAEAELCLLEKDYLDACAAAKIALDIDPGCMRLYDILEFVDPDGSWKDRRNIQAVINRAPSETPSDPRLIELYNIYKDWFEGYKESATNRLVCSKYYTDNDWEFMLASARISVDERDWRSAKMMYDKIIDSSTFVICEAAETYTHGRDPTHALMLYNKLECVIPRALKGMISVYEQLNSDEMLENAVDKYVNNEHSGIPEYSFCILLLKNAGRMDMATSLLDTLSESDRDDPMYLVTKSIFLMDRGDIQGSKKAVKAALRNSNKDTVARIQMARVRFATGDSRTAEKEINKILSAEPFNKDALLLKKDILVENQCVDEALDICNRILVLDPTDIRTMMTLAGALSVKNDSEGSVDVLRKVLRLNASRENILNVLGSMMDSGMYRETIFICHDLERTLPPDPLIRRFKGNAEYNLGYYMKASATFASAAELSPNDPSIWHSKGLADEARGDLESADSSYNHAVILDLKNADYWISRASVQERMGSRHAAIESYNRAIELDPTAIYPIIRKAAMMEEDRRFKEATYFLEMASVMDPGNDSIELMKIRVIRESGNVKVALKEMESLHKKMNSEESAAELAWCLVANRKRAQAVKTLESALVFHKDSACLLEVLNMIEKGDEEPIDEEDLDEEEISTEDTSILGAMALSLLSAGDKKGAMESIDRALSIAGDKPEYMCIKARIFLASDNISAAEMLMEDTLRKKPKDAILHEAMGDIKMAKAEYRNAMQEYDKCIALDMESAEIMAKKGEAQFNLGHYDKSIDSYESAVSKDPTRSDLEFILAQRHYERGNNSRAIGHLQNIIDNDHEDVAAILLYARIQKDVRKDGALMESYQMFCKCRNTTLKDKMEMADILSSAGHDDEARMLLGDKPDYLGELSLQKSVEKVLRRAYTTRCSPTNVSMIRSLGFDDKATKSIIEFINTRPNIGEIVPGSPEFQKMERQSNEVVMKLCWKNLEDKPSIPLERAFVLGVANSPAASKRIVAYIEKAMSADVLDDSSLQMVMGHVSRGMSVYDVMKTCKVGVYQARQILKLMNDQ